MQQNDGQSEAWGKAERESGNTNPLSSASSAGGVLRFRLSTLPHSAYHRPNCCNTLIPKMARFERVPFHPDDWNKTLSAFPDRIVFQTAEWISFLIDTQKGEPVIAALKDGNETLGYFSGLIVKKFGLKI